MKFITNIIFSILNYKFLAIIFIATGCASNKQEIVKPSFKFRNINVDQVDNFGNKQFSFKTDKAFITESSKSMKAVDPLIILYQNNKPYYKITSEIASIENNGENIMLKNNVYMRSIDNQRFQLRTNQIVWKKANSTVYMIGDINTNINGSEFKSDRASYNHKNNKIEFYDIKDYKYIDSKHQNNLTINAKQATWYGNTNRLKFFTPNEKVITKIIIFDY